MSRVQKNHQFFSPIPFIVFLLIIFCDLLTICPTLYWRDSPEFIDVVATLGIPHPAGSPTYVLFAKLLTFLPLGSMAIKVNLVSAFWHAFAGAMLFLTARELILFLLPRLTSWQTASGSLLASLSFSLSPSFWLVSVTAEVYSMSAAFFLLILYCAISYWRRKDFRFLYAGAFIYGLSAGVHATVVFYLPALIYLFLITNKPENRALHIFRISFFFLLGFSTYLYLPIRSLANPTFDWGNPETLRQFFIHITDRKTKSSHFGYELPTFLRMNLPRYWGHLNNEIGWIGLLACIYGIIAHFLKEKKMFFFLSLLFLGNLIFYLSWKTGDGFIPSNLVLSLWSAYGFVNFFILIGKNSKAKILQASSRQVRWDRVVALILYFFVFYAIFFPTMNRYLTPYSYADRSAFYNAYDTAKWEYEKMTPNAMAITTLFWFPFRYFQDVEHFREDISIVMASDVIAPQYFNPISQSRFPNLHLPKKDPSLTVWYEYMPELINLNINERDIYYEPHLTLVRPLYQNLVPDHFLFRVVSGEKKRGLSQQQLGSYLEEIRNILSREYNLGSFDTDINSREYYMSFLLFSADYLILHGATQEARVLLKAASDLRPQQGTVELYLAQTDLALGYPYEGIERLQNLIRADPNYKDAIQVLGRYFLTLGDLERAYPYLTRAESLAKGEDFQTQSLMLELFWRKGMTQEAVKYFRKLERIANFVEEKDAVRQWEKILAQEI